MLNSNRRFSWETAQAIRAAHKRGVTQAELARQYGVTQTAVSAIICFKSYKQPLPTAAERREARLLRRNAREHGITVENLKALGIECHICGGTKTGRWGTLHTDHDHRTGKVRGKLCVGCNQGLGHFRESIRLLKKAISYLRKHGGKRC